MSLSLFKRKAFVGIDLGHHSMKAVQVEKMGGGWKVTRVVNAATPEDAIKDSVVVDPEIVGAALRQLLRDAGISASYANIAVSGGSVVVRSVRIPRMPEATLRKSIKFEASRYVPSSVEDSYIEFEILGQADDQQMDVLVVAAPKDVVESRVKACEQAGLEVEAVDVEAFAAYRSLIEAGMLQEYAEDTIALVDIGASTTNMSVIRKGVFAMTRSIPQGGHTLTEALKAYFKLSYEDAESGKAQLDMTELIQDGGPIENPPLRVLQPHIDDLIREIRRSLNYYQSQQNEGAQANPVNKILLAGGGAKMLGMAQYVAHKLALETKASGVFENPLFSHSGFGDVGAGLDLAVASGLAMRTQGKAA
ncbi:MAG TPA: type IV pilus assembly protein PilM [Fimbriimonadaceae bacterium]|nr:type IV pilus assembly protein PilM [Fimbriimonadaceae bacterium]